MIEDRELLSQKPHRERTLAVIFGASEFPHCGDLFKKSVSFKNSAEDFKNYLLSKDNLNLPEENVKYLFDSTASSTDIIEEIFNFIRNRAVDIRKNHPSNTIDVIIYFVGHADTHGYAREMCFAIRNTRRSSVGQSSILCSALSTVIKEEQQGYFRRHIILDCCYAAEAVRFFQSDSTFFSKIEDVFPQRGTALLCSSSKYSPSISPDNLQYTAFSKELLEILEKGDENYGDFISLYELRYLIRSRLDSSEHSPPLPELYDPEQHCGEVSRMPLFPNRSKQHKRGIHIIDPGKISEKNLTLEFSNFIREVICYNQGLFAQYNFLAAELHRSLKDYMRNCKEFDSHSINELRELFNSLANYLNRNLEIISRKNFTYIKQYFKNRHSVEPRTCIKAGLQKNGEQYIVELFRDTKINYLTEYPISANTGFQYVNSYGRGFFLNNIPKAIASNEYVNARINHQRAKKYWEKMINGSSSIDDGTEWRNCWENPQDDGRIDPDLNKTIYYKSTLIIPMTFWNNDLDDSFKNLIKVRGDDIGRLILGYLCFDHIKEDFFYEDIDVDMSYIFADLLSLYMLVQLTYTKFSDTFQNAQKVLLSSSIER